MIEPDFARHKEWLFEIDGSLRDVVIADTTLAEYDAMLAFVRTSVWRHRFVVDGNEVTLPTPADELRFGTGNVRLNLWLADDIVFTCHFFTSAELEWVIDPRDVQTAERFILLQTFIRALGQALSRDVLLFEESFRNAPSMTYLVTDNRFVLPDRASYYERWVQIRETPNN